MIDEYISVLFPGITKVLRRFEFFDALFSLRFDWTVAMAKKVINDRRNSKVLVFIQDTPVPL